MVGHQVKRPTRSKSVPGPIVMKAVDVTLMQDGQRRLHNVNFELHENEVLSIIGVSGNGQAQLAQVLSGLAKPSTGKIEILGHLSATLTPSELTELGVARIPEDRNTEGAIGALSLWQNAILQRVSNPRFSKRGIIRGKAAETYTRGIIENFDVRGGTPQTEARLLSGGNLQKLILGRNLSENPRILIAAQPARGLDEGAIAEVHRRLLEAREAGAGILLISEELEETMLLADRVQAIVNGRLSPPVATEKLDGRQLGFMMAGEWAALDHAI